MSERERRRRATVEALLDATSRLSEEREFDEQSVLDICIEAGVSISSFYHRFPSKDALLQEVHRRYLSDVRTELSDRARQLEWDRLSLPELVERLVHEYLDVRMQFAPRARTMALAEQRHPELARARQWEDRIAVDTLTELISSRFADGAPAADDRRRINFIARVVVVVAQDLTTLERNFSLDDPMTLPELGDQLAGICTAYMAPLL